MQKLDENTKKTDLQLLINELEQKITIILNITREQSSTIKRLKKENTELRKQSSTPQLHFGLRQDQVKEVMGYIAYIDECIKFLENQKKIHE